VAIIPVNIQAFKHSSILAFSHSRILAFKHSSIQAFFKREVRRMNLATEVLNIRNYARCEWKCMEWITNKIRHKAIRRDVACNVCPTDQTNSIHCSGQRGDNSLEEDTRRPLNQVEGRLKKVESGRLNVESYEFPVGFRSTIN